MQREKEMVISEALLYYTLKYLNFSFILKTGKNKRCILYDYNKNTWNYTSKKHSKAWNLDTILKLYFKNNASLFHYLFVSSVMKYVKQEIHTKRRNTPITNVDDSWMFLWTKIYICENNSLIPASNFYFQI